MALQMKFSAWYKNQALHIAILVLVAGAILIPKMVGVPLHDWDESRHAVNALEMLNSGNWVTITYLHTPDTYNIKFPLGVWLIAINYQLFGVNEVSVRLWSVLLTIGTTVLIYLLGSLMQDRGGSALLPH